MPERPWPRLPADRSGTVDEAVFADDRLAAFALRARALRAAARSLARPAAAHGAQPAAALGVPGRGRDRALHPAQTVSYRIRRLRELLGDDLDDPTVRFELLLVLEGRPRPL